MVWLQEYERQFSHLRINRTAAGASPHKLCMLLAVMDLMAAGHIRENQIHFDTALRDRFTEHFNRYRSANDRANPHLPFFHLRSEAFWHHRVKPGHETEYAAMTTASGPGAIQRTIAYAYLDEPLFELLMREPTRSRLKSVLIDDLTKIMGQEIPGQGQGWGWLECEHTVQVYFAMLDQELKGQKYSKAEYRRHLLPILAHRSQSAIEYKLQNISAVLIELGYPYIAGYKPAFNYQAQLRDAVEVHLAQRHGDLVQLATASIDSAPVNTPVIDWAAVLEDPPERLDHGVRYTAPQYNPRKYNFAEQETRNRRLGELGEGFVMEFERERLRRAGRDDLVDEIEWTSRERGDGAGYDIRSFRPEQDRELLIEVKTTNSGKYQPFLISENEVAFSRERADEFALYRVFQYRSRPKLFILDGDVSDRVLLEPRVYRASL